MSPAASRLLAGSLAWALLGAAPASGQAAPSAATDSVTFQFAWAPGTEGRVRYTQVIEREGEGGEPTRLELEGEYVLHVHEHPQGLLIEHLDPLATRFQSSPPLAADDPRRLIYSRLGPPTPHYVVSLTGELLGVDGIQALAAAIADILGPQSAQSGDAPALVGELLNPSQLLGGARDRWNAEVGVWLDATLTIGEAGTLESTEVNALMPTVVVPYLTEFRLEGMEPCDGSPEATATLCAHLEMVALTDPVEMNRVMNQAMVDMGFPTLSFDGLTQQSRVTLLTDPATLLPRELTMTKLVEGVLKEGDQARVFRRYDQTRLVYTYEGG